MNERRAVVLPHDEVGKQIIDLLKTLLGVPGNARWFEVRFEAGQPITFTGEFYAQPPEGDVDEPPEDPPTPRIGGSLDER